MRGSSQRSDGAHRGLTEDRGSIGQRDVRGNSQRADGGQLKLTDVKRRSQWSEEARRGQREVLRISQSEREFTKVRRCSQRSDGAHRGQPEVTEVKRTSQR